MKYYLLFSMILISISPFILDNCYASHISYKDMEDVIDTSTVIIVASLINTGWEEFEGKIVWLFNMDLKREIQGEIDEEVTKAEYVQILPYIYDKDGVITGYLSIVLDGSGLETELEDGRSYILFAENSSDEDSMFIFFRAELLENEDKILEIINSKN